MRGGGPLTRAGGLSGGNQQKVVAAREIARDPKVLIAAQPTRGLDVGAIEYLHRRLVDERDEGRAILLVSLELEEILSLSDRILVIYEGEIVGEHAGERLGGGDRPRDARRQESEASHEQRIDPQRLAPPQTPEEAASTGTLAASLALKQRAGGIVVPVLTALLAFLIGGIVVARDRPQPAARLPRHLQRRRPQLDLPSDDEHRAHRGVQPVADAAADDDADPHAGSQSRSRSAAACSTSAARASTSSASIVANWIGVDFAGMSRAAAHPARDRRRDARRRGLGGHRRLPQGDRRRARGDLDDHAQLDRDLGRRVALRRRRPACRTPPNTTVPISNDVAQARSCRSSGAIQGCRGSTSASSSRSRRSSSSGLILNRTTLGYEVRAVGFNPEAAAYGGINVKKNLIRAMAISGAFAGLAGALDMLGYLYHFGVSTSRSARSRLPRHRGRAARAQHRRRRRASARCSSAALLFGTTHGLSSNVIDPSSPATSRTSSRGCRAVRRRRRAHPLRLELAAEAARPTRSARRRRHDRVDAGPREPGAAHACATRRRSRLRRRSSLGVFAAFLAHPADPGALADRGRSLVGIARRRARHLDGHARPRAGSAAARSRRACSASGSASSRRARASGNLNTVFNAALIAQMFVFSTPLVFGAIGGMFSERSGVVNIGLEGMMLMGAFWGVYGADKGGSWVVGILVAHGRGRLARARPRVLRDPPARRPDRRRDRGELPRARRSPATSSSSSTTATTSRSASRRSRTSISRDLRPALPRARDRRPEPDDLARASCS